MGFTDIILIVLILTGAGYLFYRSFIKKKGCSNCTCTDCALNKVVNKKKTLENI
jgi:hypothetical protein